MLELKIEGREYYDENKNLFLNSPDTVLHLEHSLISVSKWESKWHKPFLKNSDNLTSEEIIDYIKCMTISPSNVPDSTYQMMTRDNLSMIIDYIKNPMTATWFSEDRKPNKRPSSEIITSELIYYWMVALQIPFECQKWHLNRLITLVRVCNAKNEEMNPNNKMSKRELMSRNAALNAQRRARLHSKG